MNNNISVPNSEEQVKIHLTVKEILTLAGDKFNQDHATFIQARKKIRQQLEGKEK